MKPQEAPQSVLWESIEDEDWLTLPAVSLLPPDEMEDDE